MIFPTYGLILDTDLIHSAPSRSVDRTASNCHARAYQSTPWRGVSYGTSALDDAIYHGDEGDFVDEAAPTARISGNSPTSQPPRTLFLSGLSERTTYKDLMSAIKGGKIVSCVMNNSSALVTFATGAAEFLAWSKRNDIYLQDKRVSDLSFYTQSMPNC